jgi:hypothetical protein
MPRVLLTLLVAAGGLAAAQPPADKKDPQAKFEPKSKPGEGQAFLARMAGDWDVVKTFHLKAGEPTKTLGTCKQAMTQDGRFLQSDFVFDGPAGKTTGTGLIGFEPETGKFTSVWIDSRQTRMSFRQGEEKFDGKTVRLVGRNLGEAPKDGGRVSRTTTTLDADNNRVVHRQVSVEADGTERLVMQLVLTRRAGGKAGQ